MNCVNLDVELRKLECWILQTTKLNRETNNVKSTIGVEKLETWIFNCTWRYKLQNYNIECQKYKQNSKVEFWRTLNAIVHIISFKCSYSSHINGPYFIVFSSLFFSRLLIHGQLISMVMTFLLTWFTNLASTRLARTSWWAAYTCTSHQASTQFPTCTPPLGSLASTTVVLPQEDLGHVRSRRTGLFKTILCLNKYLFWASAVHPARMCGTLSWAWPHSLHFTSSRQLVCVLLLEYSFVGSSCSYISNTSVMVCVGHDLHLLSQLKHPFLHSCESNFRSVSNFPCHSNPRTSPPQILSILPWPDVMEWSLRYS